MNTPSTSAITQDNSTQANPPEANAPAGTVTATAPAKPTKPAKPNKANAVRTGIAEAHAKNEVEISNLTKANAELKARISALESQKPEATRQPVGDAELTKAMEKLTHVNNAAPSVLNLSLKSVLDFQPELTEAQKKLWRPVRDAIRVKHSNHVKAEAGLITATLKRAAKLPHAILAGGIRKNKQGKVTGASLRASKMLASTKAQKATAKGAAKPTVSP